MAPVASGIPGKSAHRARTFPFQPGIRLVACSALIACSLSLQAQLLDSLALFSRQRPRVVAKLDTRGSFISNASVRMVGVKAGLEHAGRLQYGIGYSFLYSKVEFRRAVDQGPKVLARLHLQQVTPYVEYAFYQRDQWEVRIPVQFGLGQASLDHTAPGGGKETLKRSFIFFYEPAMSVQYRFLRYFGASAGWGFRLQLANADLGEPLSAPVYLLGVKVFMGDLVADLKR